MKNIKSVFSFLLVTIFILPVVMTGCAKPPEKAETPETPVLKVAALSSGYEAAGEGMWKAVTDAYTKRTGTKVRLILEKNLEDVIGASMQGGDYPDVILLATGRTAGLTEQFIKDRNLIELGDILKMKIPGEDRKVEEKLQKNFLGSTLTNPYPDKKIYLMPMFYSPCGLFYNETLFKEKGYQLPETFDDFWKLGEEAKKDGISLFTYPTTGYLDTFFYSLLYTVGGPDFFTRATHYEEGIFDSKEGKECLEIMAKLATYTNKKTPSQANDQDFTKNQLLVMNNEALFMPNGTWISGEMQDAPAAKDFKWGMMPLPSYKEGGKRYSYTWMEQIWMPKGAKHVQEGKEFIAFLYGEEAASIFKSRGAIQPIHRIADTLEGEKKNFYGVYDRGALPAMGGFAPYQSKAGLKKVSEYFFDPMNSLVSGNLKKDVWFSDISKAVKEMRKHLISK